MKKIFITIYLFINLLSFNDFSAQESDNSIQSIDLLNDHSYSWWVRRRNVYYNGVNYFTTINMNTGSAFIHRYDGVNLISVEVNDNFPGGVDEHNAPSFLLRQNDILVFSHPRNGSGNAFITRTISYDFQTLSAPVNINANNNLGSRINYSQIFQNSNGRMFLFFRDAGKYWAISWSDDNGVTWSNKTRIIYAPESWLAYMHVIQDGDKLYMGGYKHPLSNNNNRLYALEFNTITGDFLERNVNKGNIYSNWNNLDVDENLTALYVPLNGRMRFLDIAFSKDKTTIYALIADFTISNENGMYKLLSWNRKDSNNFKIKDIAATGKDGFRTYFGGAYFVQDLDDTWANDTIYLSREENSTWYVEEWQYDCKTNTLLKANLIDTLPETNDYLSLMRPEPPIGSNNGGLKIIYQKGDYTPDPSSEGVFTFFDGKIIGIK